MEEAKYQLVIKAAGWTSGSGYNYETVIDRIDITEEEYKRIKKTAVFDFVPIMFGDNLTEAEERITELVESGHGKEDTEYTVEIFAKDDEEQQHPLFYNSAWQSNVAEDYYEQFLSGEDEENEEDEEDEETSR